MIKPDTVSSGKDFILTLSKSIHRIDSIDYTHSVASKSPNHRSGVGLVQSILALAVLGIIAIGANDIFFSIDKGTQRSRAQGTMLALESVLLEALQETGNYQTHMATIKTALSGTVPLSGSALPAVSFVFLDNPTPVSVNGVESFYDIDGNPCTTPGSKRCFIGIKADLGVLSYELTQTNPTLRRLRAAYRIRITHPSEFSPPIADLGATTASFSLGTSSDPGDFQTTINEEFLGGSTDPSCEFAGIPRGWDLANNRLTCWTFPDTGCDAGSVLRGFTFQSSGTIALTCSKIRIPTCSNENYALRSVNFGFGTGGSGRCVPMGPNSIPKTPVWECPTGYTLSGTNCVISNANQEVNAVVSTAP